MKDYIIPRHHVTFADQRLQLAFNMVYCLPGIRDDLAIMLDSLPRECIEKMTSGKDYENCDLSIKTHFSFGENDRQKYLTLSVYGRDGVKNQIVVNYGELFFGMNKKNFEEMFVQTSRSYKGTATSNTVYFEEKSIRVENVDYMGCKTDSYNEYSYEINTAIASDFLRLDRHVNYNVEDEIHRSALNRERENKISTDEMFYSL